MNLHDVHELQDVHTYPCLTITLPTHRTSPDNKQDPIRVKNLVTEGTNRLLGEFPKREVAPLIDRLNTLVDTIDYKYTLDGLLLVVNRDMAREYVLPFTLNERVVVDETFFTRDLVHALNRTRRYWVVALSEQATRLFAATREDLEAITTGGFPMRHTAREAMNRCLAVLASTPQRTATIAIVSSFERSTARSARSWRKTRCHSPWSASIATSRSFERCLLLSRSSRRSPATSTTCQRTI